MQRGQNQSLVSGTHRTRTRSTEINRNTRNSKYQVIVSQYSVPDCWHRLSRDAVESSFLGHA